MDRFLGFLADNYGWFFVAAVVLLFALIGFIVDAKKRSKKNFDVQTADAVSQPTFNQEETQMPSEAPQMPEVNKSVNNNIGFDTNKEDDAPSLDNFESNVSEVDVGVDTKLVTNEGPSLVIEDKGNEITNTFNKPEEESVNITEENNKDEITLVIEDKKTEEAPEVENKEEVPTVDEKSVEETPTEEKQGNNTEVDGKKSIFE